MRMRITRVEHKEVLVQIWWYQEFSGFVTTGLGIELIVIHKVMVSASPKAAILSKTWLLTPYRCVLIGFAGPYGGGFVNQRSSTYTNIILR